ncbi:MAG: hypothetical protein AAGA28_04675 [Pseudomonadota bacterium]
MSRHLVRDLEHSGSRISRNAHIALRAERIIARRRLAVIRSQTGLLAFAGALAGIGVLMANVGAFFWLAEGVGYASAGGILAAVNVGLAALLGLVASRMSADRDLEPVVELRDMAMEEIEAEVAEGVAEVRYLANNLRRIAADPFGAALPSLLGPVLTALVKSLRK